MAVKVLDNYRDALKFIDEEGGIAAEVSTIPDNVDHLATVEKKRKHQPPTRYESDSADKNTNPNEWSQKKIAVSAHKFNLPDTSSIDPQTDSVSSVPIIVSIEAVPSNAHSSKKVCSFNEGHNSSSCIDGYKRRL